MSFSKKYATFENNNPKFAPYAILIGKVTRVTDSLNEKEANDNQLKLVIDERPITDNNHYAVAVGWNDGNRITRQYEIKENEKYPRRWSRLSIKTAIANAGKMNEAKNLLQTIEIAKDYTAWEALTDCNYIEEFWPSIEQWNNTLDLISESFNLTRKELDSFVDQIPREM